MTGFYMQKTNAGLNHGPFYWHGLRWFYFLMCFTSPSLGVTGHSDLATMAALIHRMHISHPPMRDIPVTSIQDLTGYLARLDPYSAYFAATEAVRDKDSSAIREKSIGGWVARTDRDGLVLVPFHNGPAYQAGIKEPLRLTRLNGQDTSRLNVNAFEDLVESQNSLYVEAENLVSKTPLKTTIAIRPFDIPAASSIDMEGQSILQVHSFPGRRAFLLLQRYLKQQAAFSKPAILDLRYAVGGNLFEALDSVSLILPQRLPIATTITSDGLAVPYKSRNDLRAAAGPVYILIGPHTSSAAEVFARALHYHGYAVLVGQTSFGKCLIQQIIKLPAKDRLRLTVGRVLDPAGQDCKGQGIQPDIAYAGNLYDTTALLGLIHEHNRTHRLICQEDAYPDLPAWEQAVANLGWIRQEGRGRPISLLGAHGGLQACLGPPMSLASAQAVLVREGQRINQKLALTSLFSLGQGKPAIQSELLIETSPQVSGQKSNRTGQPTSPGPTRLGPVEKPPIPQSAPSTPEMEEGPVYSIRMGPFDTAQQVLDAQNHFLKHYHADMSRLALDNRLVVEQKNYLEVGEFETAQAAIRFCARIRHNYDCQVQSE